VVLADGTYGPASNGDDFATPVPDGVAQLRIEGVAVRDSFGALSLRDASTTEIKTSTIENVGSPNCTASSGIAGWFNSLTLRSSKVHGFHIGLHLRTGTNWLRDTEISGNAVGLVVDTGAALDMGTNGDLGGNTLQGNSDTGLAIYSTWAVTFHALGNTWLPFNQGTNGAGQFPIFAEATGPYGGADPKPRNVLVSQPGPTVKLAPLLMP
jgi:hypothetical protein